MNFAPVAMFVHARATHTRRTLEALVRNDGAQETALFVFADAARSPAEAAAVDEVRALLREDWAFKAVHIVEREHNLGLARSIVDGVSAVTAEFGAAIIMEDDLETAPGFLTFMNRGLLHYGDTPEVWHINGWTYPLQTQSENRPFFTSIMECWGWATWHDRWQKLCLDPDAFLDRWTPEQIDRFNIGGGYDSWRDLRRNQQGTMRTWAVFWYASMFAQGGLCLSPPISLVRNIGIDGSGSNSGSSDIYHDTQLLRVLPDSWPERLAADDAAFDQIKALLLSRRPSVIRRALSSVKWQFKRWRVRNRRGRGTETTRL